MKHKIYCDEELDIVREEINGSFSESDVGEYFNRTREVLQGIKNRRVLVDFTNASRKLYDSKKVREMMISGTVDLEFTDERVALLVKDPVVRLHARVMAFGSKTKGKKVTVKWFDNEQKAIAWLIGD